MSNPGGGVMRRILNLKGIIVIAVVAMFLAVATIYAAQQIFDVNIKTTVQLGISAEDPLQPYTGKRGSCQAMAKPRSRVATP